MKKFYCNNCNEEVDLVNGKCPKCNTNWNKIINDSLKGEDSEPININGEEYKNNYKEEKIKVYITENDINDNILFFLKWAQIAKIFIFIVAIITVLLSFVFLFDYGEMIIFYILMAIGLVMSAIIIENLLKWKAYMLYTNKKDNKRNN